MNKKLAESIIKYILIIICVILFGMICGLVIIGYDTFFTFVIDKINLPSNNHVDLNRLLYTERRIAIWGMLLSALLFSIIALCFYKKLYTCIKQLLNHIIIAIKNIWKDISDLKSISILIIPFTLSIYLGLTTPVSYDEAYTYITFVSKPFYYSISFYPNPNNHILYSILANITEIIPFFSELFCLRLPSILISLMSWCIGYSFVKRNFSKKTAISVIGITSVLFMSIYYSFIARGYGLCILFFIISFYATYNIIKKGSKSKDWIFLSIASILGVYTMPSFLYPLISLNVLIFIFNYRNIKQQIAYSLISGITTLILYSPIMILQRGLSTISNNRFVTSIDRDEVINTLPSFLYKTIFEIFHICPIIIIGIITISFIVACLNKDKFLIIAWLIFIISPFILLIGHSVIPFPRTFIYYGFTIILLTIVSLQSYIEKLKTTYIFICIIILQITSSIYFINTIAIYESNNTTRKKLNDFVLKEKNKKYYLTYSINSINFEYEYLIREYDPKYISYDNNVAVSADSINGFDFIIIDRNKDATKYKTPIYKDSCQIVYSSK